MSLQLQHEIKITHHIDAPAFAKTLKFRTYYWEPNWEPKLDVENLKHLDPAHAIERQDN